MENIIELHAKKLKEEVGIALNYDECFDLIKEAIDDALNKGQTLPIHDVSVSFNLEDAVAFADSVSFDGADEEDFISFLNER